MPSYGGSRYRERATGYYSENDTGYGTHRITEQDVYTPRSVPGSSGRRGYGQENIARLVHSSSNESNQSVSFLSPHSSSRSSRRSASPGIVHSLFGRRHRSRHARAHSEQTRYLSEDDVFVGPSVPAYTASGTGGWENAPPSCYNYKYAVPAAETTGVSYAITNVPAQIYVLQPQPQPPLRTMETSTGGPPPGHPRVGPPVMVQSLGNSQTPAGTVFAVYPSTMLAGSSVPLVSVPPPMITAAAAAAAARSHGIGWGAHRESARHSASSRAVTAETDHGHGHEADTEHNRHTNRQSKDVMQIRHICNGCGRVRSRKFHDANPVKSGKKSLPNFCRKCRESFDMLDDVDKVESGVESDVETLTKDSKVKAWLMPSETSAGGSRESLLHATSAPTGTPRDANSDSASTDTVTPKEGMSTANWTTFSTLVETPRTPHTPLASIAEEVRPQSPAAGAVSDISSKAEAGEEECPVKSGKKTPTEEKTPVQSGEQKAKGYHSPSVESVLDPGDEPAACKPSSDATHVVTPDQKQADPTDKDVSVEAKASIDSPVQPTVDKLCAGEKRNISFPLDGHCTTLGRSASGTFCSGGSHGCCTPCRGCHHDHHVCVACMTCQTPCQEREPVQAHVSHNVRSAASDCYRRREPQVDPPRAPSVGGRDEELDAWLFGKSSQWSGYDVDETGCSDGLAGASVPPYNFDLFSETGEPIKGRGVGNRTSASRSSSGTASSNGGADGVIPDYNFDLFSDGASSYWGPDAACYDGPCAYGLAGEASVFGLMDDKSRVYMLGKKGQAGRGPASLHRVWSSDSLVIEECDDDDADHVGVRHIVDCEVFSNSSVSECGRSD